MREPIFLPLHAGLDCAQYRQLSAGELESAAGHGAIEGAGFRSRVFLSSVLWLAGAVSVLRSHARAKAAKVIALDGSRRCVLYRGALRRAVLERGASSYLDALPLLGGGCVSSVSGPTIPDSLYV